MSTKSTLRSGTFLGLLMAVWLIGGFSFLTLLHLNTDKATLRTLTGGLGLVLLFMGILYAIRSSQKRAAPKPFSYFMAFKTGMLVAITVAVIVSLASFVYIKFLNPHFSED